MRKKPTTLFLVQSLGNFIMVKKLERKFTAKVCLKTIFKRDNIDLETISSIQDGGAIKAHKRKEEKLLREIGITLVLGYVRFRTLDNCDFFCIPALPSY
jgi:hypothetical protein